MQALAPEARSISPLFCAGSVALALALAACGGSPMQDAAGAGEASQASEPCDVDAPAGVVAMQASEHGLALAVTSESGLRVQRMEGAACDLTADGTKPVAAGTLLDFDNAGNLYVFPAAAGAPDEVSTWLEDGGADSVVEKVDLNGKVSPMVHAGRGIWAFGMAPEGPTFLVTACGPTGIFSGQEPDFSTVLTPPDTLWNGMPSVLTDAHTLWSVGYLTCSPTEPASPDCGYALTRTTPEGSEELGPTLMDFGKGYEQGALARCGTRVCGLFASGVVQWNAQGALERTLAPADLGAEPGARILQVAGNAKGLYLLLEGKAGNRVVYVPTLTTEG